MVNLLDTNPHAHGLLFRGCFAFQRSQKPFAQATVDMAIEQIINKDIKVKGGIIGKSLKPAAVQRWMITAHAQASITAACAIQHNVAKNLMRHRLQVKARSRS